MTDDKPATSKQGSELSDVKGRPGYQSAGRLAFMQGSPSKSVVPTNIKDFARDEIDETFSPGAGDDGCTSAA